MSKQSRLSQLVLLLPSFLATVLQAGETAAGRVPQIDADTRRIMKEWGDGLREARSFAVNLETRMTTEAEGFKQEVSTGHRLAVSRPNRFAYRPTLGGGGASIVSDGTSLHSYLSSLKRYIVTEAPASVSDIPTTTEVWKFGIPAALGGIKLLEALVANHPDAVLLAYVDSGQYLGTTDLAGVKCHRLKFVQDKVEWEAFVQVEKPNFLLRIVPDLGKTMQSLAPQGKSMKVSTLVTLSNWSVNTEIPESEFVFVPPAEAEKVETLRTSRRRKSPFEGLAAPDFVLDLLDGGKLNLAALTEKRKILVLSFWTAAHPIGVSGLAMILPVVKQYEDRDVLFYAVNVRDKPEVVRKILADKGLSCPVALDRDAKVAKQYGMRSFFHTVVIAKDGKIARVFLTLQADLQNALTAALDALLGGEETGSTSSTEKVQGG